MDIFVGVIVGLLVLMLLVTAHEFGHFIAARRNGVNVLEFGIGFPPRLAAWVKDEKTKKWRRLPKAEWGKPQKGLIFSLNLFVDTYCIWNNNNFIFFKKHFIYNFFSYFGFFCPSCNSESPIKDFINKSYAYLCEAYFPHVHSIFIFNLLRMPLNVWASLPVIKALRPKG